MKLDLEEQKPISVTELETQLIGYKKPIKRFVFSSSLVHILTASAIMLLGQFPQPKPEIIEIDFSSAPISSMPSAPMEAPEIQEAAPLEPASADDIIAAPTPKPEPKVSAPAPVPQKIQSETTPSPKPTPVVKEVSKPVVAATPVAVEPLQAAAEPIEMPPATLDDIETPTLDDSEIAAALQKEIKPVISKEEIDKQLAMSRKAEEEKMALLTQQLSEETDAAASDLNDRFSDTQSALEAQSEALAAQAQARGDALQAEAAATAAAASQNTSEVGGNGDLAQTAGPGKKGELRALEQLRQMPGNPKPDYAPEERLQGQQGTIIFKAFVTDSGKLTHFEMVQSTGHRNLDFKTLRALKQWKFYPGQQGWVELPFRWDLKGGPQEMPTLLRRRVGQQQN